VLWWRNQVGFITRTWFGVVVEKSGRVYNKDLVWCCGGEIR
jgi:hypothetical protein